MEKCGNGHQKSEARTYVSKTGRQCMECRKEAAARRRSRMRSDGWRQVVTYVKAIK